MLGTTTGTTMASGTATADPFARYYSDVHAPDAAERIAARLATDGLATFEGVDGHGPFYALANRLTAVTMHRDADPDSGITTINRRHDADPTPADRAGRRAFTTLELRPHTDGTARVDPPVLLWLLCTQAAAVGGDSVVVDGSAVYRMLYERHPAALAALIAWDAATFGDRPAYSGPVLELLAGDRMRLRHRQDELVTYAEAARPAVPLLQAAIDAHRRTFRLARGQGFVLVNGWWLHGRTAFSGTRELLRLLGTPHNLPDVTPIPAGFPHLMREDR